jgi:hypothetical protein
MLLLDKELNGQVAAAPEPNSILKHALFAKVDPYIVFRGVGSGRANDELWIHQLVLNRLALVVGRHVGVNEFSNYCRRNKAPLNHYIA